jgi:hypothetical protein
MTDLFERRLAERLQAHPLPEEVSDIGARSVRLGERMRRRRIGAVVVVLAVLLMIPAASGFWRLAADTEEAPAISPSAPPAQASTGPKTVILDLGNRPLGAAPDVSTVRGKSVWLPSGETVKLPPGQFGSIAEYGSGLAWLTRTGGEFRLNVSPERLPIAANGSELTGAEAGPRGSVMVRTKAGPVFLTSGAKLVAPPQRELRTNRMVATAEDIWVENGGRVLRVHMADLERGSFQGKAYPQWQKVVLGDPRADRLLVIDDLGCQGVVNGSTAEWLWRSCDWDLSAFSSDGRLGAGRSVMYGTIGVIDLSTDQLALGIQQDMTPVGPRMVFDEAGRLNFTVGSAPVNQPKIGTRVDGFAFMVCDLAGECWVSSDQYADPIEFVLPNRK